MRIGGLILVIATVLCGPAQASRDEMIEILFGQHDKAATVIYPSPNANVIEFYNQNLQHYFRTAEPAEAAAVDAGAAGPGWVRTGEDFPAWTAPLDLAILPVCRFYAPGPNSHFYTIEAAECAAVKLDPGWRYEGTSFYALKVPLSGQCPAGTSPLFRVYNGRFAQNDSNHRFVVKLSAYSDMVARGWKAESTVMCVSALSEAIKQKTGQLIGGTWRVTYTYGISYTDRLTFTGFYTSSSSGTVYAQGTNQWSVPILGTYDPSLDRWAILSPYSVTSVYPHDWYLVTLAGNSMTGCYWFVTSSSSSIINCNTPLTGSR